MHQRLQALKKLEFVYYDYFVHNMYPDRVKKEQLAVITSNRLEYVSKFFTKTRAKLKSFQQKMNITRIDTDTNNPVTDSKKKRVIFVAFQKARDIIKVLKKTGKLPANSKIQKLLENPMIVNIPKKLFDANPDIISEFANSFK